MKRNLALLTGLLIVTAAVAVYMKPAHSQLVTNVPPDISAEELEALVVEDFENSPEWTVETDPRDLEGENANTEKDPVTTLELKIVDGSPSDLKPEAWQADDMGTQKTKVLGVNYEFKYPGYNVVYLIPPDPIQLPGRAKGLSLWVHGRGNDYYLEAWIKDYTGSTHILKFGSINFVGWKPLSVDIPAYIPQSVESYPQTKILTIERLVIRADPSERVRNTFFFFDQIKVLTQTYEVNFDGMGLENAFESAQDPEGSRPNAGEADQAGDGNEDQ
ncbi:MAG: flagellar filament outer layer protein FlaA [Spirochaetota bacterium]